MKTTSSNMFSSNGEKLSNNGNNRLADMTLTELQDIAIKQQQQIEINQQLLLAKEKRLKILKLEEQRNQQLNLLSQSNIMNSHSISQSASNKTAENSNKLENLKQNVLGQELKIFKLKELRNQILKHKLSNSNMSSELDLIKSLFAKKERELCDAVKNVAELTKQIDQLRKIKTFSVNGANANGGMIYNSKSDFKNSGHVTASELEKLKQELQIRNKLNEQQSKKIMQQHELFNQKQIEVLSLDKRIEELQNRISSKKILGEQLNQSYNNNQNIQKIQTNNNNNFHKSNHEQEYADDENENGMLLNQQFRSNIEELENECENQHAGNDNSNSQKYASVTQNTGYSPSKQNAKFATKQEIANTYMNKFGSEAYQRYQMNSIRNLQQQQHQQQRQNFNPQTMQSVNENKEMMMNQQNKQGGLSNDQEQNLFNKQANLPNQNIAQSTSQLINNKQGFMSEFQLDNFKPDPSTLPSHLKHEFDKIKFLPDMVKTIKKRHSISEIEGSAHHVPPLIFQRMIQNHHKNFLDQKQMQLKQIKEQEQVSPNLESKSTQEHIINESKKIEQKTAPEAATQSTNNVDNISENKLEKEYTSDIEASNQSKKSVVKSTKPIIKNPANSENHIPQMKRRVNFNPHALLLDAAVEGELDLVMKCAKLVADVSEPNDEGITALHNSVCAGHFDIVKFLVEFGCDINFADNDGWTPLHCAASCNNSPMVKFLIEHGASIYASTVSDNETAIKKCEEDEDGFEACYEYLHNAQENLGDTGYNNALVYTLYEYEAQNEDELAFKSDEKLVILNKNDDEEKGDDCDGWWTARSVINNEEGLVPNNFLGLYPRVKTNKKTNNQHESTIC